MRNPILEMVLKADIGVRLYALNGLALSFANEIEDSLFWAYWQTSGQAWEAAADEFYRHVRFAHKQEAVDTAVKARVAGEDARAWFDLIKRTQALLGKDSLRNLIGHNVVSTGLFQNNRWVGGAIELNMEIRQFVTQKREMAETGRRAKISVTEDALADYCQSLIALYLDLESFLAGPLQLDPKHPGRYSAAYWGRQ